MSNHPNLTKEDAAWTERLRPLREPVPAPRPFVYTRIEAQLQAQAALAELTWWLRRPAYAGALALLVLGLNAGAAVRYAKPMPVPAPLAANGYTAFVADYHLDPFDLPHE